MIMYHLFYSVKNKKKSYTETKCFMRKNDALDESIKLCQCANVDFVSIREVDVKSINLEVYKHPDKIEIEGNFIDLQPTIDWSKVDMNLVCSSYTGDFQVNNPLLDKSFNEILKEHFKTDNTNISINDLRELSCQIANQKSQ